MSIQLHCEHCGKKIEAPDSAGGKWGKCPSCHNKVYVPGTSTDEELTLMPIDENEEQRKKQLLDETHKLEFDILLEREAPEEGAATKQVQPAEVSGKGLMKDVILCLRQMADSQLAEAEQTMNFITPHKTQAVKILDRIGLSEIPEPELADIKPQVLSGLIRTLRSNIS
ncbi:MAG: hypothetical protein FVQ80_05530 [Planctomycetes bacterium]|nr:hypothetical protein [Planctomycetota bacterium]